MTHRNYISAVAWKESFARDFKRLSADLQEAVEAAVADLAKDPIPVGRRMEKLAGFRNPEIYTIHVTGNHSHKISFELEGGVAHLRRVARHRVIDRAP